MSLEKQSNIIGLDFYKGSDKSEFEAALRLFSITYNIPISWLLWLFYIESSLKPTVVNPITGAFGLYQLMPSNASIFGISFNEYKKLSGTQQLGYLDDYLKPYFKKIHSPIDLYLSIFYPAALNYSDTKEFPQIVKKYNPGYVINGSLTRKTIESKISKHYSKFGIIITNTKLSVSSVSMFAIFATILFLIID